MLSGTPGWVFKVVDGFQMEGNKMEEEKASRQWTHTQRSGTKRVW